MRSMGRLASRSTTISRSASLCGVASPCASEPNSQTARTAARRATRAATACRTSATARSRSRKTTPDELDDLLGMGDRLSRVGFQKVVERSPGVEAIGIARGNVVSVEPHSDLAKLCRAGISRGELVHHGQKRMAPGLAAQIPSQRLDGLLGRLMGRKTCPVVVSRAHGVVRMSEIMLCLSKPVSRAPGHLMPLKESVYPRGRRCR